MVFNRSVLMKAHALLATFILPVAIMFLVTGAFYTWGVKGGYDTTAHELSLEKPLQAKLSELVALAEKELMKRNLPVPTGQAGIKKIGSTFKLEWTGSNMDVILEPTSKPLVAQLKIKQTSWYRQFVQLHKAKGGTPFKVYATVFATVLLLLLITGFIMAWQVQKIRSMVLFSTALGIMAFVVMIVSS